MKRKKGISLIVLVITIIVIIILAGSVILSLASNNPIAGANEATFKNDSNTYSSELSLFLSNEYVNTKGSLDPTTIYASKTVADANSGKTLQQIITSMTDKDASEYVIYKGKLIYIGNDLNKKIWANTAIDTSPAVKDGLVLSLNGLDFASNIASNLWLDGSGSGNHSIPNNFNNTSTSGNAGNGSVAFDGSDDYVIVNNPLKGATVFTIGFWFKQNSPGTWSDIFTFDTGVDGTAGRIEYSGVSTGYMWFSSGVIPSAQTLFMHDGTTYDYIVIKCDGTNVYCYKNGVVTYTAAKVAGTLPTSNTINIGRRLTGSNWKGNIKSLHMYNRSLTNAEIQQNYNAGS